MKNTKNALLHSVIALLLCVSMLVGTTFAWFTDSVTSGVNQILAGNLDVELVDADGKSLEGKPLTFLDVNGNANILWEPGCTFKTQGFRVSNEGNLALKYTMYINGLLGDSKLLEVIEFSLLDEQGKEVDIDDFEGHLSAKTYSGLYYLVGHMAESANNDYQGLTLTGVGITVHAAQLTKENDSFGSDYDKDGQYSNAVINYTATAPVIVNAEGKLEDAVTIGKDDDIQAEVPAGALLVDGAKDLGLSVKSKSTSDANLQLEDGETAKPMKIEMPGLDPANEALIKVTIPGLLRKGLNFGNAKMYHVENGVTIQMIQVQTLAELDAHNEFYYDPATGDVTICTKSFSEYVAVTDNLNPWKGDSDTSWYDDSESEFVLENEDDFAGFRDLVDSGTTFEGKTVKLNADIDLHALDENGNRISFNPIGCGYVNGTKNSNDIEGKAFEGTFDGQNHVIRNLYQNGWDLGLSYCTLGGGLFASVHNATICKLTMVNADIVMECVEQGVVAGLAQGNCTFDNINIYNCSVANYQRATGGVVGEASWGADDEKTFTHTFSNIKIDTQTVIGSLWGDFDAPVGGVIGGYWDDSGRTRVTMENVDVACRLDVYNDVTSTYQWYAYRRAGMLIGNSDNAATTDGRTVATTIVNDVNYLTCENVTVRYGNWVNYHYCEFSDYNASWPFVRAEAGENCTAFSNPRWGVPELNGVKVTPDNHPITDQTTHADGDDCMVLLPFGQLYGGGQGVYGQTEHDGVTIENYIYAITYINNGVVLDTVYIKDNSSAQDTENDTAQQAAMEGITGNVVFSHWINAGSTKITKVDAGNTDNITLYPSYTGLYMAMFVDQQGNILNWTTFTTSDTSKVTVMAESLKSSVPVTDELTFDYWEVHVTDAEGNTTTKKALDEYTFGETDITIYPVYTYNGDVNLIPVDNNGDGITDEYQVGGYSNPDGQDLVEIPDYVNGIPITSIAANAFSSYEGVHSVVIPTTVTTVGGNVLATDWGPFDSGETVTIYYEGSYADWIAKEATFTEDWDDGLGEDSRIFFLNGTDKVDPTQGYLQADFTNAWYQSKKIGWNKSDVTASLKNEYDNTCDCSDCDGADRPDRHYWSGVEIN